MCYMSCDVCSTRQRTDDSSRNHIREVLLWHIFVFSEDVLLDDHVA